MKRLIIFDFFGVIGNEISPKWFKKHVGGDEAKILKEKYIAPADLGEYSIYDAIDMISADLGFDPKDIIDEWVSYKGLNNDLMDLILKLRENNTVCLLSNAAEGIFEMLYDFDFDKYFEKYFFSYACKMAKPDLRFFDMCISSFGMDFDEIYFIDDNIKNISAVKDTKIKGILFTGNDEILPILQKLL